MQWKIKFHPLVIKEDFKKLGLSQKRKIIKEIKKKLTKDPLNDGEPLKGSFKGFRKLKVSEFRVIYEVIKDRVLVLIIKIGIRKDYQVYKEFFYRLKKII
ncbi:MAG TPA: type II toxin-antitoxin system mRNA interferase toxin, RelE/StbE family [Candidatus Omnitrophica bacterium]|nr:type II toxin-antitoxin system mRNA interferase toxin, RelE/StbE family [Candidatus Omnitrophota bacterium]